MGLSQAKPCRVKPFAGKNGNKLPGALRCRLRLPKPFAFYGPQKVSGHNPRPRKAPYPGPPESLRLLGASRCGLSLSEAPVIQRPWKASDYAPGLKWVSALPQLLKALGPNCKSLREVPGVSGLASESQTFMSLKRGVA